LVRYPEKSNQIGEGYWQGPGRNSLQFAADVVRKQVGRQKNLYQVFLVVEILGFSAEVRFSMGSKVLSDGLLQQRSVNVGVQRDVVECKNL
jgi:hypothetical protein